VYTRPDRMRKEGEEKNGAGDLRRSRPHPQSDDSARQTRVVRHREVTGLWVGIVAG
jgi:hypothetical protein